MPGPPATASLQGRLPPLVAVAHGSRDPRASATVEALLGEVRLARPGIPVHAAYLDHSRPSLGDALAGLDEAVVLPLLLTEAYHSRVDIPSALREARASRPRLRVHQGATLGPHPLLITALERRLAEAGVEIGDPDTAVVLVSAGSSDHRANAVIAAMAREWALSRGWHSISAAYASAASPTPEEAVLKLLDDHPAPGPARAGTVKPGAGGSGRTPRPARVVVAPYLLASGHFADKVRRDTLEAGASAVADPLGPAPELVTILLERYAEGVRASRAGTCAPARA
ncbi:sirohydrochlorin chelatase [Sphaerisporangium sp. NPDC088356]|uniref:sirohydrochlorin chelatase n=1 Tax=Sphaerisporangium sp. NPDC088356 TaxID=3154871 RepID=UPI003426F6EF